ncbi:hypothetical protein ACIRPT_22825 [Streptomyces sp. NPDC101227]|uniref:hypothetical protein n=1 Tax=Streptomyces sp. NPDC101227 TaxID=3366136 RepID=UPI0037FEA468
MTSSSPQGPAPDATLIKTGRNQLKGGFSAGIGCAGGGLIVIAGSLAAAFGLIGKEPEPGAFVGVFFGLVAGFFGVTILKGFWDARHAVICVDHVGLWISNPKGNKVIPWDGLAGVGLYWSKGVKRGAPKQYSIELCPNGPIDRDHPVVWNLVRDEEPLHPSLPRLRYRLPARGVDREPLVAAVRHYAAHLWLGEVEREPGHIGHPDIKGHRARTRGVRADGRD